MGYGTFAKVNIDKGTVIAKCKDVERHSFTAEELEQLKDEGSDALRRLKTYAVFESEDLIYCKAVLAPWILGEVGSVPFEGTASNENFINHSCDPNLLWNRRDELVARCSIMAGEELTYDYATEDFCVSRFVCGCKSPRCRSVIEGEQWRDLIDVYGKHFKSHLLSRMDEESPLSDRK